MQLPVGALKVAGHAGSLASCPASLLAPLLDPPDEDDDVEDDDDDDDVLPEDEDDDDASVLSTTVAVFPHAARSRVDTIAIARSTKVRRRSGMRTILVCVFALASMVACTNKDDSPTPGTPNGGAAGGGGSESNQGAQAANGCPAGSTKNTEGGYCIALPADVTPSAPSTGAGITTYEYNSSRGSLVISVQTADDAKWTSTKTQITDTALRLGGQSKGTGDNFYSGFWNETDGRVNELSIYRTKTTIISCNAISLDAQLLHSCQTISAL